MEANTKGQKLVDHLLSVALLSESIVKKLKIEIGSTSNEKLAQAAFFAGLYHDLGKIDPKFQDFLKKKKVKDEDNGFHFYPSGNRKSKIFEETPRHNEISYFIVDQLGLTSDVSKLNKSLSKIIKHAVFYHHAKPIRDEDMTYTKISNYIYEHRDYYKKHIPVILKEMQAALNKLKLDYTIPLQEKLNDESFDLDADKKNPSYKSCYSSDNFRADLDSIRSNIRSEAISSLIRSVIITADRVVSSGFINKSLDENLKKAKSIIANKNNLEMASAIHKMESMPEFKPDSIRSKNQEAAADKLAKIKGVAVLNGPAGAGKTKISLSYLAKKSSGKAYYVAPRSIICQELYSELKTKYLPNSISIEIATGDIKKYYNGKSQEESTLEESLFDADIVITTIDQISKSITTHKNITLLTDILSSDVVFDEFHEYATLPGLNLFFAEIVELRKSLPGRSTLLMSATPHYFFLSELLDLFNYNRMSKHVVDFETFNQSDYRLTYRYYDDNQSDASDPFFESQDPNKKTIVISNTATTAQLSFIENEDQESSLLAHSKYPLKVKNKIFSEIKKEFGSIEINTRSILRSGPIAQASLNITSERLITELSTPENIIQRLGRLNRYNDEINPEFIIAIPNALKNGNGRSKVLNLLSQQRTKEISKLWITYLIKNLSNGSNFKLKDIYLLYRDFYQDERIIEKMSQEYLDLIKMSYKNISLSIPDPVEVRSKKPKDGTRINAQRSIRGASHFARSPIYKRDAKTKNFILTDNYSDIYTLSREELLLYSNHPELITRFRKKANLLFSELYKKGFTKYCNDGKFLLLSLNEKMPVLTGFSRSDLNKMGKRENKEQSIIYIQLDRQDVGYINIDKLNLT